MIRKFEEIIDFSLFFHEKPNKRIENQSTHQFPHQIPCKMDLFSFFPSKMLFLLNSDGIFFDNFSLKIQKY